MACKTISTDELSAFVEVARDHALRISIAAQNPPVPVLVDTCGTGGDGSNTFNISTAAALVLAAGNVAVAKHGNRSMSSSCGSADVLEALGIATTMNAQQTSSSLQQHGFSFLFAPRYHPAFQHVANVRKELGIRTVFNIMGPLLNPAPLTGQVIGVADASLMEIYANVLLERKITSAMIVHGSGIDELALHGPTNIMQLHDSKRESMILYPKDIGLRQCSLEELKGGAKEENAAIIMRIFSGERSARREVVILNAAAGFMVAGKAKDFKEGMRMAAAVIDSGAALEKVETLRRTNQAEDNP
ncbi:anthranilate phosphoribosyltransferase [Candidatus Woesearchaeota archaeon]|nr:anthranilate phosphoribosyltransferase [Candidatus Woesearchaeota archaeon]